jgi:hypothetical protein
MRSDHTRGPTTVYTFCIELRRRIVKDFRLRS